MKDIKIHTMKQLKTVPNWIGVDVKVLDLDFSSSHFKPTKTETTENLAMENLVFALLRRLPCLKKLTLTHLHFKSFTDAHSRIIRSTQFLPNLSDLRLSPSIEGLLHSIVFDPLGACNIVRMKVQSYFKSPPLVERKLDFGGRLRYLDMNDREFTRTLLDPARVRIDTLAGLRELRIGEGFKVSRENGVKESFRVIGPTLEELSIGDGDMQHFYKDLPDLVHLQRLSVDDPLSLIADNNPLPPSLSFLSSFYDQQLRPVFERWTAVPTMVPTSLQHIHISLIEDFAIFQTSPRFSKLSTDFWNPSALGDFDSFQDSLASCAAGSLPFKVLEVTFYGGEVAKVEDVRAECKRIGVEFRPIRK